MSESPPPGSAPQAEGRNDVVLAVGAVAAATPLPAELAAAVRVHAVWSAVSAALLARVLPDAVIAPLCGEDFDVIDLAERLSAWGYGGCLLVVAPPLPDPELVLREIASACPGIAVRIVAEV